VTNRSASNSDAPSTWTLCHCWLVELSLRIIAYCSHRSVLTVLGQSQCSNESASNLKDFPSSRGEVGHGTGTCWDIWSSGFERP
jgi:hypothetical protein